MEGSEAEMEPRWGERAVTNAHVLEYAFPAMEVPFSLGEYQQRLRRVREVMAREGIDLLYLTSPESLCYLSGYQSEWYQAQSPKAWPPVSGIAVHVDHERFILFDQEGEAVLCRYQTIASDVRLYRRDERGLSAIDFIVSELQAEGWLSRTVGLELWSYRPNPAVSAQFRAAFEAAGCQVVDGTDVVREVRSIKSPQELAYIETAMRIADIGMQAAIDHLRPGMTELEVYAEIVAAMARAGGENPSITIPVLSGAKTMAPHALASRKQIMPGEIVIIDLCGVYNRYHANLARTFSMGEPHPDVARVVNNSAGVYQAVSTILRPHLPVRELNEVVRRYYEDAGIWESRRWVGGYELGIAFPPDWVGPFVYSQDLDPGDCVFAPGMVINYESQFYLPNHAGFSLLIDTIVFTEQEARILSRTPRELIVIE